MIVATLICVVIIVLILLVAYNLFRNNVDDSHQETINNNATQKVEAAYKKDFDNAGCGKSAKKLLPKNWYTLNNIAMIT